MTLHVLIDLFSIIAGFSVVYFFLRRIVKDEVIREIRQMREYQANQMVNPPAPDPEEETKEKQPADEDTGKKD